MRNLKDILWLLLREKRNKDKRSVWDEGDFYKLNKGRVMHSSDGGHESESVFHIPQDTAFPTPHPFYSDK